ncbi:14414_t:CDS:2 [Dentiscutata erythropus]|uniref:14414_t:CDS:1 n=1 Tax=Dentiscutata erythropus TaxID=1348616 RepID=A0A9N9EN05_9GLOM|nr:14414_t:CDS:2 [Dentiscutata erythropus]
MKYHRPFKINNYTNQLLLDNDNRKDQNSNSTSNNPYDSDFSNLSNSDLNGNSYGLLAKALSNNIEDNHISTKGQRN